MKRKIEEFSNYLDKINPKRRKTIKDVTSNFFTNHGVLVNKPEQVYSPYSIYSALSIAKLGSNGNTLKEFETVLGTNIHEFALLNSEILKTGSIEIAQGLFLNDVNPKEKFIKEISKFSCAIKTTKFPEPGEKIVNDYVAEQTKGNITNLISGTNNLTKAVLINAIYFKEDWADPFDVKDSIKDYTFSSYGKDVKVAMMVKKYSKECGQHYGSHEVNDIKFTSCSLPYKDFNFSLLIIKPEENTKKYYSKFEEELLTDESFINNTLREQTMKPQFKELMIPKFKIESKYEKTLESVKSMGIKDAFDQNNADFSKLTKDNDVFISQIFHAAKLEIDEKGITASASTACMFEMKCMPPPPKEFILDQPFYCFVIFNLSNTVLFAAKIEEPKY